MAFRSLRNLFIVSFSAVITWGALLSCENPFSNNLGKKVDVAPPTISVESPTSGAFVKGVAQFSGVAAAYRELRQVEVKIFNADETQPPLLDWTSAGIALIGDDVRQKNWTYHLNTLDMEDGFLKIQFRALDPSQSAETVELVYIIKNNPSVIKMTAPDSSRLDAVPRLTSNTEIRGQIIDRRGLKPGYPRIKIWLDDDYPGSEPDGDDAGWGWAQMFLSGIDDPDRGTGFYADRENMPVVRAANFVFRLADFAIDPETRQVAYDGYEGEYKALRPGRYRFRIISSDTFFNSDINEDAETYLFPREPGEGETEIIGYYPSLDEGFYADPMNQGPAYSVQLITSGVRPTVELDNSDIPAEKLEERPHIYIAESTAKKILIGRDGHADFRLQILAVHPDLIDRAELSWEHSGAVFRSGSLAWDSPAGSLGYVAADTREGHYGRWKDPGQQEEGKLFTFTADGGIRDESNQPVFISSSEPYTLIATVTSMSETVAVQKYTLYLDANGPDVSIRSVRGAAAEPSEDPEDLMDGGARIGLMNKYPYTVNGNIQVAIDRSAGMGILAGAGDQQMVKWIVEAEEGFASDPDPDNHAGEYLAASGTILSQLKNYRYAPSAAGIAFFDNIGVTASSGWIDPPDRNAVFETDRFNSLKLKASPWDGKYVWLYIIAEDGVNNLGFMMQRLYVDEATDRPQILVDGLAAAGGDISSENDLYVALNAYPDNTTSGATRNVLDRDQGINLEFIDDDGISLADDKCGVSITLTNAASGAQAALSPAQIRSAVNGRQFLEEYNSLQWSGVLSQPIMAAALYAGEDLLPSTLRDGIYFIDIKVSDNADVKIKIGDDAEAQSSSEQGFYFAVQSDLPAIDVGGIAGAHIEGVAENSMQSADVKDIGGRVKSRLKIQRLTITFDPVLEPGAVKLVSTPPDVYENKRDTYEVPLYSDPACTSLVAGLNSNDAWDSGEGNFVYYWKRESVSFDHPELYDKGDGSPFATAPFEWRRFSLRAWDGLGNQAILDRTVRVDNTPPTVESVLFNFGRPVGSGGEHLINGKVALVIRALDDNGIRQTDDRIHLRWWVLPSAAAAPEWETPFPSGAEGAGGQFYHPGDHQGSGSYMAYFDSTVLTEGGEYALYAIAEDNAGNRNTPIILETMRVYQAGDYPALLDLSPADGAIQGSPAIMGKISDDDGFSSPLPADAVQIQFPGSGWITLPVTRDAVGDITFSYDSGAAASNAYFNTEGEKSFRLRITDDARQKNPDRGTSWDTGYDLPAVTSFSPSESGWHTFTYKTRPPAVFFSSSDPAGHDSDHRFTPHTNDSANAAGNKFTPARPVFRTREQLAAALAGGYVQDGSLASVYFLYNVDGASPQEVFIKDSLAVPVEDSRYYWTINPDWLAPFDAGDEGMHYIIIEATDSAGNKSSVAWSFYKDATGPEITFNISEVEVGGSPDLKPSVVFGEPGSVFLRGQFRDEYTDVANVFSYRFDNGAWNNDVFIAIYGEWKGRAADWAIPVPPGLVDGEHTFDIRAADIIGNETEKTGLRFIIDTNAPVMTESEHMKIAGSSLASLSSSLNADGTIDENKRVFSNAIGTNAADTTPVFTISGLVYERNLSQLAAYIYPIAGDANPITVSLDKIDEWRGSLNLDSPTPYDGDPTTNGIFSIKVATQAEIDSYPALYNAKGVQAELNHTYLWTLTVTRGDLFTLKQPPNDADNIRRQIVIVSRDLAGFDSGRKTWRFFLDSTQPKFDEFLNLNSPNGDRWTSTNNYPRTILESETISLQGIVSDDTNVKEIRYSIGKWDYAAGAWRYWGGSGWTLASPPAPADWPNMINPAESPRNTVYWTLDSAALGRSGVYPPTLFNNIEGEGRYVLSLQALDYSISGSAVDVGNPTGVWETEFFIDRSDPAITWDESNRREFYRVLPGGNLLFHFTASDPNTISSAVTAILSGPSSAAGAITAAADGNAWDTSRLVTVTVPANTSMLSGRYTLTVTVTDGAGKSASINNTLEFYLDNNAPEIDISVSGSGSPSGGAEAITGRVVLRGNFKKTSPNSPVSRVAFYIPNNSGGAIPAASDPTADSAALELEGADLDAWLAANDWLFAGFAGTTPRLMNGTTTLAYIDDGLAIANITLPNTRNFLGTNYWGDEVPVSSAGGAGAITFGGTAIAPATELVRKLIIYVLAVDEAGHRTVEPCEYWVYPEGDRPKVGAFANPNESVVVTERLLNGRIRISGSATDNVRVKNVWVRVSKETPAGSGNYAVANNLQIPVWNEFWEASSALQSPQTVNGSSGWYMANGGGSTNVPWWMYINTEGELDPIGGGSQQIRIEVMSEDTTWNDELNSGNGAYETTAGLYSNSREIDAFVIAGAPSFDMEQVKKGPSDNNALPWENVTAAHLRARASYRIRVKHDTGLRNIRWIRPDGSTIDLLNASDPYNASTYAAHLSAMDDINLSYHAANNPGIAVKAEAPPNGSGEIESYVTVDINSEILENGAYRAGGSRAAQPYLLNLSATETSAAVPLTSTKTAEIPIDNVPPKAMYTHTSNVAGTAPTFGGVAGDATPIGGLSRVVLWFSRSVETSPGSGVWQEKPIPWEELDANGVPIAGRDFAPGTDMGAVTNGTTGTIYGGLDVPLVPEDGSAAGNYSCIVIDRNDPQGTASHHGHKLRMGFATVGGELGTSWYVVLDSTKITSGRVTAHFVAYDKAGNGTYYSQKLMVLNGVPRISQIKLGTDIRGDSGLQSAFLANGSSSGNYSYKSIQAGALQTIRGRFGIGADSASSDAAIGISDYIPINNSNIRELSVVYDEAFNARNNLLAVQVEIPPGGGSGKERTFRVEYVSGARLISGQGNLLSTALENGGIKAGRVYIINDPGSGFPWGSFGAQGDAFKRGFVFLAIADAGEVTLPDTSFGSPSAWELNSNYYSGSFAGGSYNRSFPATAADIRLDDVTYPSADIALQGASASFVYRENAFSGTAFGAQYAKIHDIDPELARDRDWRPKAYPQEGNPWERHSLFIVRVFDGQENEFFGDFTLLSIRVNNNDKTPPFAQLYDLNPKTEGADNVQDQAAALDPSYMGQNRTRGGLYNAGGSPQNIVKSGHIEPRQATSLTSPEMGGAAASPGTINRPYANSGYFFGRDTVSGQVILRGYAEDDQRIQQVALRFDNDVVTILESNPALPAAAVPVSGFLRVPGAQAGRVSFTETIDLNRHRVEWAYYWDTEKIPAARFVGNINILAIAHNANTAAANNSTPAVPKSSLAIVRGEAAANQGYYDYFNSSFPPTSPVGNFQRYNNIPVNIRPYITGFRRNQSDFSHNTRSRQGRYMFARGETVVVEGFNLGGSGDTKISLPGMANADAAQLSSIQASAFGIADTADTRARYRVFQVSNTGAITGAGTVTLAHDGYPAVNTGTDRPMSGGRPVIQPWNIERNPGIEGSDLWDDFTAVHIWQSSSANTGTAGDNNFFGSTGTGNGNWIVENPAMSINPNNGTLYASWNEGGNGNGSGGGGNNGTMVVSNNSLSTATNPTRRMSFIDPIIMSDIYFSTGGTGNPAADVWAVSSIIGRNGADNAWTSLGGVFFYGPQGYNYSNLSGANSQNGSLYLAEATFYNASSNNPGRAANPPTTDQFENPHIVTSYSGGAEHIHVSYYDTKDGSVKYRYNRRGSPGTINGTGAPYAWTNLDGGYDEDDQWQFNGSSGPVQQALPPAGTNGGNYASPWTGFTSAIAQNGRIVNYAGRPAAGGRINAGKHNSIAVSAEGYPVVAYFDQTNQRLKLAVSRSAAPIAASEWVIRDYVIPADNLSSFATGEYVSIKIDTSGTAASNPNRNRIHIAALNSVNKQLVYITGMLSPNAGAGNTQIADGGVLTNVAVQVVDSVGDVGRWCSLSLDSSGNPWIAYHDESYSGSKDGVKVAYRDAGRFYKGGASYFSGDDIDVYGASIAGWEAMHVPTQFRVENARVGLECYPTIRNTGAAAKFWGAAVGYLSPDYYRIAYYVE